MVTALVAAKTAPTGVYQPVIHALIFVGVSDFNLFGAQAVLSFFPRAGAIGMGAIDPFEGAQMWVRRKGISCETQSRVTKRCALTKAWHIGAKIIDPDIFGAVFLLEFVFAAALGDKQHVGFNALGIKDASGQAKDSVEVALVH